MAKIGELYVAITGDNSSLKSSLNESSKSVSSFGSVVTKQVAGLVSVTAAVGLAVKGIQFNAAAESAQQAFAVMLGSAEDARDMLKELRDFANNTPLEFADIRQASQTLLQFGVDADSVIPTIKQLGDVSGGDAQKLQSLALAFGQMSSTGRLMGQDLLQMINAGFNPLRIISEQTGKSMADLKKEMEAGAISSEMVAEAFKIATSEGGQFYQMLEKQAGTINGAFSTLNDSVDTFLGSATEGMSGPLVQAMQDASKNLGNLGDNFSAVGDVLGGLIIVINGVANAVAFVTDNLNGAVLVLGAVAVGFGLAFGPVVGVIAGVVAAIGLVVKGISDIVGESDKAKKAEQEAFEAQKKRWKEMDDYYSKKYPQAVKGAMTGESEALKKLMQEYRDAGKTKIQLIDDEEKAALAKAKAEKATEADLGLIRKFYAEERKKINKATADSISDQEQEAYATQMALLMEFEQRDAEAAEEEKRIAQEAYDYQLSLLNEFEQRDIEAANEKSEREGEALEASERRWEELSRVTGEYFSYASDLFSSLGNAATKFGNDDLGEVLDGLASVTNSAGNAASAASRIFASGGADVGAWVQLVTSGIDIVSNAWDSLFNNNSDKRKKEREEEKRAEEERLAAVAKLDEEYTKKTNNQLENLELERDKAIAEARRIGANVFQIEKYYAGEIAKIRDGLVDTSIEEERVSKIEDLIKKDYDNRKAIAEAAIRLDEKQARSAVDAANAAIKAARESGKSQAYIQLVLKKDLKEAQDNLKRIVDQNNAEIVDAFSELDEQMRVELEKIVKDLELYQSRAADAAGAIGSELTQALVEGTSEADFTQSIMDMLRKMAIDAAILAGGFAEQFNAIGVMIAEALKDGLQEAEVTDIRGQISSLYGGATAAVADINKLFDIPGFAVGTNFAPGGMAVVGEYGPELVSLPRGASVQTNAVSEAKMGNTINLTQNYYSPTAIDPVQADRLARRAMREGVYA